MGVLENKNRIASISSSNAHLIVAKGSGKKDFSVGCYTYLDKLKRELRFKSSLDSEFYSRPTAWGNIMERYVSDNVIDFDFKHIGDKTFNHQSIDGWVGTPDFISDDCVAELKSYYPEGFTKYAEAIESKDLEFIRDNFKKEYWQIVSNACVLDLKDGAACTFMPKFKNLNLISDYIENYEGDDIWKYRFIYEEILDNPDNPKIPFIPKESTYDDWNIFRFEVPKEDKEFLTDRINLALKYIKTK